MAKPPGKLTIPIFARIGAREHEIGTIEIDVDMAPAGKVKPPKPAEFVHALKKVKVR